MSFDFVGVRRSVFAGVQRRRHELPFPGEILVQPGDTVEVGSRWAVGRPVGQVEMRDVARISGLPTVRILEAAGAKLGRRIPKGAVLTSAAGGIFGRAAWTAGWDGELVQLSTVSGLGFFQQSMHEVSLFCRLGGVVVEVEAGSHMTVEGQATSIRCAFGAGGTGFGGILVAAAGAEIQFPFTESEGPWVVVITEPLEPGWLRALPHDRVAAVIAPSVPADRYVALAESETPPDTAEAKPPSAPVVLTEGICRARMPPALQRLFRAHAGRRACVVASSRPGETEVLLSGDAGPPPGKAPLRIAAGSQMGAQASPVGESPNIARNAAGLLVEQLQVQREEGGRLRIPMENLELLA